MKKQEINICESKNQNINEVVSKQISRRNNGQIMTFSDEKKIDWNLLKSKENKLWDTMTPKIKTEEDAIKLKANADGIYTREIANRKREINNEIFEEARKIDSSFDVQKYASQYGLTNESELFAEAFANSQLGEPNVLGQAMNKWLERQGF